MPIPQIVVPAGAPFVKVTRTIYRPIADVFDPILEADVTHIFPDYAGAPGTVSTTISKGWNRAGLHRVSTSSDGATYSEDLLSVETNQSFSYRVQDFTAPALHSVAHIEGTWIFTDNGNGTTSIEWVYALAPTSAAARADVEGKLIPRYQQRMEHAINIMKRDAEGR